MTRTRNTPAVRRLACLGLVGVLAAGGAAVAQTHAGKRALERAGVTRPAAAFSEVVLRRVAVEARPGGEPDVRLEVAIHDAGPRSLRYRYAIAVLPSGGAAIGAGRGSAAARAGGWVVVRTRVPLRCGGAARAYVAVTVEPQPGRSVGAWLACPVARGRSG